MIPKKIPKRIHKNNKSILKIPSKDLKVKDNVLQKKLIRLLKFQMMIIGCNQLIQQKHMHMKRAKI